VRLLFAKRALAWPRVTGHDVHSYHLMQACARLGASVHLVTATAPTETSVEGLTLATVTTLNHGSDATVPRLTLLQERFRSYYGISPEELSAIRQLVRELRPDALVAVGLDGLPWLAAVEDSCRVWYAADEWVRHHLSQVKATDPRSFAHLRLAAIKGAYERAFSRVVDRAWVVSLTEARAMRRFAGIRTVDVVPNGVDGDFFAPLPVQPDLCSAVFWGRLDFGPNVQALRWFCSRVWPTLRARWPAATFTIMGFAPVAEIEALAARPGVRLARNVPDIREVVCRHAVVVLPFVSGGGIKNKLLEAAALARPIVCTPRAVSGLQTPEGARLLIAESAADFAAAIDRLWRDPAGSTDTGRAMRDWVLSHHTWQAAARAALGGIRSSHRDDRP
jgi:glycosyltransferase involved in cell wall biosynthesis